MLRIKIASNNTWIIKIEPVSSSAFPTVTENFLLLVAPATPLTHDFLKWSLHVNLYRKISNHWDVSISIVGILRSKWHISDRRFSWPFLHTVPVCGFTLLLCLPLLYNRFPAGEFATLRLVSKKTFLYSDIGFCMHGYFFH